MSNERASVRRKALSTAACTLSAVTLMLSTARANEEHVCRFDYDERLLAYRSLMADEDVLRATCLNSAMLHMAWHYQGAEGHYPRGVLSVHSSSETLAFEGPVEAEKEGRQILVIRINAHSALVRLIRRSDVEIRYRTGSYRLLADRTGCIEALLTACILSRPAVRMSGPEPD
jgi:hypothetical protein